MKQQHPSTTDCPERNSAGKTKEVKLVKTALEQNPFFCCNRAAGTASPEGSAGC